MTLNDYQQQAINTNKYLPEEQIECLALGLTSESGEVSGKVDKHVRCFHNHQLSDDERKALAKEIGDCLWYCANLAYAIGYSLDDVAAINIHKLAMRDERGNIDNNTSGDDR